MPSFYAVFVRLLLFKGQKQQLIFAFLFIVNFLFTLFSLKSTLDDDQRIVDRRMSLVAMAHSPGADVYLMPDMGAEVGSSSSDGYSLAKRVQHKCSHARDPPYTSASVNIFMPYASSDNRTQLCATWKVATTFFKRLFMIENKNSSGQMTLNPYDISFSIRYIQSRKQMSNSGSVRRFMFTRDPYSRLYTAYVDKLFAPNPLYWKAVGVHVIKAIRKENHGKSLRCGHDLKFSEYIKYVILTVTNTTSDPIDGHSVPMTLWCKPCSVKYDFIGKIETFRNDSLELVKHLKLTHTERLLREKGEELAVDDAIRDTLHRAFDYTFQTRYKECISFREALTRCWKKLQYCGLIGDMELTLSDDELENLSFYEAVNMAKKARAMFTKEDRQALKRRHFMNLYSSVTMFDLEMLKHIYRQDFDLFEYDPMPTDLFVRI